MAANSSPFGSRALDRSAPRAPNWREDALTCYALACAAADRTQDPELRVWMSTLQGALRRDDATGAAYALDGLHQVASRLATQRSDSPEAAAS